MGALIEIINITKKFDDFVAVDDVNLNITKGSFIGLLGPNGAGKTTLIKVLIGLLKPTEGEIYIEGQKMNRHNNDNFINILPLTHSTNALRDIALKGYFNKNSIIVLFIYSIAFYIYGVIMSYRELD